MHGAPNKRGVGGKCYIGMTNKPINARLRSHNGLSSGGATYTRNHRPWKTFAVVRGARNKPLDKMAALVLEHALHHPRTSPRLLDGVRAKKGLRHASMIFAAVRKQTKGVARRHFTSDLAYRARILKEVLSMDLWSSLRVTYYGEGAGAAAAPAPAPAAAGAAAAPAAPAGFAAAAADEIVDLSQESDGDSIVDLTLESDDDVVALN